MEDLQTLAFLQTLKVLKISHVTNKRTAKKKRKFANVRKKNF